MNMNIVIRKNYSEWFDIDVDVEEVLGTNYEEIDKWDYYDIIQEYVTNMYGEHHDVKIWDIGVAKKTPKNFVIQIDEYTCTVSDMVLIGKIANPRRDYIRDVRGYAEMIAGDNFDYVGRISYILVDREVNDDYDDIEF